MLNVPIEEDILRVDLVMICKIYDSHALKPVLSDEGLSSTGIRKTRERCHFFLVFEPSAVGREASRFLRS